MPAPNWKRILVCAAAAPCFAAQWNPRLAADYLDQRQKEWLAWPPAVSTGSACVSCHTNMTYLLARPALRRILDEPAPTRYETALLDALRTRVKEGKGGELVPASSKEPMASQRAGVEAILGALLLGRADPNGAMTQEAFQRMWAQQITDGSSRGSWKWFELDRDPWETGESPFYGAALAAVASGAMPAAYREKADIRERISALAAYLRNSGDKQPLHNRAMLLWSAETIPEVLATSQRRRLIDEIFERQQPDGGWSAESAGPWKERPEAPPSRGSDAYITAFLAFTLEQGGVAASDPRLAHALTWLRSHQDPKSGYWQADSMNKVYPPGSMQVQFMRDAATAFASLALASNADGGSH